MSERLNLTGGVRVDFPMYFTDPVDNPFSRGLTALDENGQPETVDQSSLPGTQALFSPRIGFNWNAVGDRNTQIRGGTGIFTGRIPFVWFGNVISNPGANPNLPDAFNPAPGYGVHLGRRDPPAVVRRQRHGIGLQVAADLGHRPGH